MRPGRYLSSLPDRNLRRIDEGGGFSRDDRLLDVRFRRRVMLRDRERHTLELRDGTAESLPRLGIVGGLIDRRLSGADAHESEQRGRQIELAHDRLKPTPALRDLGFTRKFHVVESERAAPESTFAPAGPVNRLRAYALRQ